MSEGHRLLLGGNVRSILFSGGTYQIEVFDPKLCETFWPFLQVRDEGDVQDAFCSCEGAEKVGSCPHLAAALIKISNEEPLHVRFYASFWNQLCLMGFKRHGSDPRIVKRAEANRYVCITANDKVMFSIMVKSVKGQRFLEEIIFHRTIETEETSIKFSNLPQEELTLWKRGTPSQALQYELSFWSDLAKWMMLVQEFHKPYSIAFQPLTCSLPHKAALIFEDLVCEFYIAKVNWAEIVPSLKGVKSPLTVHEFHDISIESMEYSPNSREIHIRSTPIRREGDERHIDVGNWEFIPDVGFFPSQTNALLKQKVIPKEQIGEFLSQNFHTVRHYLKGTSITRNVIQPSYTLHFDDKHYLNISCYAFESGDLQTKNAAIFAPWVYIEKRGFYLLKPPAFDDIETRISPGKIGDFIRENRQWLNEYEGFQIHLSNVEVHLSYRFDLKNLTFENESKVVGEVIDFEEWVYIEKQGFYKKLPARDFGGINSNTRIACGELPLFINENREELENVKNFFSPTSPLQKSGLDISIDEEQRIVINPHYFYKEGYRENEVCFFDNFTYVSGEGFAEIAIAHRLPEKYRKRTKIDKSGESTFIHVELPKLKPFIAEIDRSLKPPQNLALQINSLRRTESNQWEVNLTYVSEFGEVSLTEIKQTIEEHHSYALTQAGMLIFKDPRFNWIRNVPFCEGGAIVLSPVEWIRLRILEDVLPPTGQSTQAIDSRTLLQKLDNLEGDNTLNLRGLKSTLRPYQELGVKWLWSLYYYGLSGLLCDDMGLGKTHQAMALLAGIKNIHKEKRVRYFIVCPTSVISHWEELLKVFLPHLHVTLFYGTHRSLKEFDNHTDVLLTSYGTLRSERRALANIEFEAAILDEIQIAKNANSQTHHALKMLNAQMRIGLTGTPIENHLQELKALFDIILPSYLPPHAQYREMFVTPIEKFDDYEKKKLLSRIVHPFLLRRKKSEVLKDLPKKTEEIAYCYLSEEQKKLYHDAVLNSRDTIVRGIDDTKTKHSVIHIFALINKLKQICNHPCLVTKDFDNYKGHQSGKWDLFVELLDESRNSGQKVVVFSQYLGMIAIIERYLKEQNIKYASIKGRTRNRKKQLQIFRDDPRCEVFTASLQACGTGIDLTAASVVIHLDRWWNFAREEQATDRTHRIGQKRGVLVFKIVTKGTIEIDINRLIEKKMSLLQSIVGYDDKDQIKCLDRDDLIAIVKQLHKEVALGV